MAQSVKHTQHVNRTTQTIINRRNGRARKKSQRLSSSSVMMMAITKAAPATKANIIFIMHITFTINTQNHTQYTHSNYTLKYWSRWRTLSNEMNEWLQIAIKFNVRHRECLFTLWLYLCGVYTQYNNGINIWFAFIHYWMPTGSGKEKDLYSLAEEQRKAHKKSHPSWVVCSRWLGSDVNVFERVRDKSDGKWWRERCSFHRKMANNTHMHTETTGVYAQTAKILQTHTHTSTLPNNARFLVHRRVKRQ